MAWTPLNFGQYSGKTLPHLLLTDPDYFFWAHGDHVFKGQLASEAEVLFGGRHGSRFLSGARKGSWQSMSSIRQRGSSLPLTLCLSRNRLTEDPLQR